MNTAVYNWLSGSMKLVDLDRSRKDLLNAKLARTQPENLEILFPRDLKG